MHQTKFLLYQGEQETVSDAVSNFITRVRISHYYNDGTDGILSADSEYYRIDYEWVRRQGIANVISVHQQNSRCLYHLGEHGVASRPKSPQSIPIEAVSDCGKHGKGDPSDHRHMVYYIHPKTREITKQIQYTFAKAHKTGKPREQADPSETSNVGGVVQDDRVNSSFDPDSSWNPNSIFNNRPRPSHLRQVCKRKIRGV